MDELLISFEDLQLLFIIWNFLDYFDCYHSVNEIREAKIHSTVFTHLKDMIHTDCKLFVDSGPILGYFRVEHFC